ncbi:hypothetical protein MELA_01040 [Candidatus Methylomirabilis lanthanidiphila]|uniref:Uncharacterized protein n=1 Tax=Candidatus Methylomirabilis lanthanidiphila TaxID=2211376 RepID=A0A564ZHR8_9BACT|nr:hypothetical protein [Candidatus Methylomirabilis lanthanidiphila]VUZ84666.1 hypothetical protein MELA_01040 [Candidatus Methylomirabilis lanthanidiphila]
MKKRLFMMAALLVLGTTVPAVGVRAEEAALALKAGATMREVLSEYTGKRVALRLQSGDEIEGTVTMVGNSLLHLTKLSGKEFYDAVVSIDKISAVRMRVRDK